MICRWLAALLHIDWPERWTAGPDVTWLDLVIEEDERRRAHDLLRAHVRQEDTGAGAPPRRITNSRG